MLFNRTIRIGLGRDSVQWLLASPLTRTWFEIMGVRITGEIGQTFYGIPYCDRFWHAVGVSVVKDIIWCRIFSLSGDNFICHFFLSNFTSVTSLFIWIDQQQLFFFFYRCAWRIFLKNTSHIACYSQSQNVMTWTINYILAVIMVLTNCLKSCSNIRKDF